MTQFIAFLSTLALLTSYIATYFVKNIAVKLDLIDNPQKRKHPAQIHKGSIPRAGGLAIFIGILIPVLFFIPLSKNCLRYYAWGCNNCRSWTS